MRSWPVMPGVPAAGHVTAGGHWHPGGDQSCHRCRPDPPYPDRRHPRRATMTTNTAAQAFLDRDTPVTAILRPYAAGEADADTTRAALLDVKYADVPHGTPDQLMGRDGGDHVAGLEAGDGPIAGSWEEVLAARDFGILTQEDVVAVLTELVARSDAKKAPADG